MTNLLLVDDNELILDSFGYHFREVAGWHVELARNGKEAIAVMGQKGTFFHGVILDKNMAGGTGDQVVRWMFEQDLLEDICVIILTGHPEINSAIDTLRMGVWQYLIKDMKPSEVQTFIAPGIAQKLLHRVRREMWREGNVEAALGRIRDLVKGTLAPDGFHVIFLSPYLTRDFADDSEPLLSDRAFVKKIREGAERVSACTRAEVEPLQPVISGAGTLMAVPVRSDHATLAVVAMESRRESAFDPRWLEVLAYFAETLGVTQLIHSRLRAVEEGMRTAIAYANLEMRHRVRNSLGIIKQSAEELRREPLSESAAQWVGFIEAHRRRIGDVIDDLDTIAQPRKLNMEKVDVSALVGTVIKELGTHEPDIKLLLSQVSPGVVAKADKVALHEVFTCLAVNALEAIEARRVYDGLKPDAAKTECEQPIPPQYMVRFGISQHGDHVEVTVTDNGIGLTDLVKKRLFNPLFSTKRRSGSPRNRGIGLFSSRQAIAEMGGELLGDSPGPYEGATFVVTLPIAT